jgi:hypothetical protein
MKKQIELTLSSKEIDLLKNALVSYQKEMNRKQKKYEDMDTEKYTITDAGRQEIISFCETTSRNIAFLFQEIIDRTNEAYSE